MAKRTLILSMILIIAGLALIIYHDPLFRQALTTPSNSSTNPSLTTFRFVTGSASSQTILSYSAVNIIESLFGGALVGFGLVLIGIQTFLAPSTTKATTN